MSESIDALSERICRLELTNLWLKCTVAAIGLALVAAVVVSFSSTGATEAVPEPPDALDAKQLVIRDVKGQMRVAMLVADDGPGLVFYDSGERIRVSLAFVGEDPRLVFYDADGHVAWQASPVTQPLPDDAEEQSSQP